MGNDWKENLEKAREEIEILIESQKETLLKFEQFCEFVAEPAFETLSDELKTYKIRSRLKKRKGESISFQIDFPRSRIDHFHYIITLPKASVDLQLKLAIKGRKNQESLPVEKNVPFLNDAPSSEILNFNKEGLIQDIIEHYRNFVFESFRISG
jgi:hypothetical protein